MSIVKSQNELEIRRKHFEKGFVLSDISLLSVMFTTTEEFIRNVLPKPLEVGDLLSASAYIAEFKGSSFCPPYNEAAIFISAKFDDESGYHCLSMPVTNDIAMLGGREIYGYPKKMAEKIEITREGNRISGTCIRRGVPIISIVGELATPLEEQIRPEPHFLVKSIADELGLGMSPKPLLVRQQSEILENGTTIIGDGEVSFGKSIHDPFHEIPVTQVFMISYTEGMTLRMPPGKILAELDAKEYTPHSLIKYDWDLN